MDAWPLPAESMPERGEVLVIDWRVPTPDRDGGSLRTCSLLRALRSLGYAVTFSGAFPEAWPDRTDTLARDTAAVRDLGVHVSDEFTTDLLRREGERYAAVVCCGGISLAEQFIVPIRAVAPRALLLYDTLDLHYVRHFRQGKLTGNANALRRAISYKARELAMTRAVDCTLVVSQVELEVLQRECPEARVVLVTDVHESHPTTASFAGRRDCLFVGNYEHQPNGDAVHYYLDEIHPLVREARPGTRFYAVGHRPSEDILARAADDVIVTGHVSDLTPWYEQCLVTLAPLRFGAGIKGKVLYSLGRGVPVVATSIAAEGLQAIDGQDLLIADDPTAFRDAIVALHEDAALWERLSVNGRALVARHFSFETVREQLSLALAEATASRMVGRESLPSRPGGLHGR